MYPGFWLVDIFVQPVYYLMDETGIPGENQQPATYAEFEHTNLVVIVTDCISSSNYHTITTTTALINKDVVIANTYCFLQYDILLGTIFLNISAITL
jgi:hypothetical protein